MSLKPITYVDSYIDGIDKTPSKNTAITTADAKDFARIDESYDDDIVDILIEAAQRAFEEFTRTFLYETTLTVQYSFDRTGNAYFRLPYGPVDSITSVQEDGTDIDYEQKDDWILIEDHSGEDIEIVYVAKTYDDADDIDKKIELGLLKWIATNYDDRENTVMENIQEMPNSSKMLWKPYRRMLL